MVSVAIDGPAGAGKSTLARRLAAEMGYIYVDTGAMFRTIGLYALRAGKDPKDNEAVNALLPEIELHFAFIDGEQHVYLKEEDVSTAIRTEEVGMAASAVGANPAVRAFLLGMQRNMAKKQDVLMDGRDIGTVVLPDATVKIFLTASPEARAARRWKEYQEKGVNTPYEEVLADVKQRDYVRIFIGKVIILFPGIVISFHFLIFDTIHRHLIFRYEQHIHNLFPVFGARIILQTILQTDNSRFVMFTQVIVFRTQISFVRKLIPHFIHIGIYLIFSHTIRITTQIKLEFPDSFFGNLLIQTWFRGSFIIAKSHHIKTFFSK